MILFKANGKEVFVLSDPMFRVNVIKRKTVYFWSILF